MAGRAERATSPLDRQPVMDAVQHTSLRAFLSWKIGWQSAVSSSIAMTGATQHRDGSQELERNRLAYDDVPGPHALRGRDTAPKQLHRAIVASAAQSLRARRLCVCIVSSP